jgi:hypothetical protein
MSGEAVLSWAFSENPGTAERSRRWRDAGGYETLSEKSSMLADIG